MAKINVKPLLLILLIVCFLLSGFLLTRTHTPAGETPRGNSRPALQIWATRNWGESRHTHPQDSLTQFQETDFYRTIVENNLFRPLGWTPPRPKEPYRLIGTILPRSANTPAKAILQTTAGNTTRIVSIGESLDASTEVVEINPKRVVLSTAGQQSTLKLKIGF